MRYLRGLLMLSMASPAGCLEVPPSAVPIEATATAAPTLLWEPGPVSSRYGVGEVRAFEFRQAGVVIGRSWGRYLGPDPQHADWQRFETRAELEIPGRAPQRSAGLLVLDANGVPVSASERTELGTQELVREDEDIVVRGPDGTQRIGLEASVPVAVMARGAIFHQELFLSGRPLQQGELELRLVPLSGGAPVAWKATVRRSHPHVRVDTALGEVIFLADGRIERIEVNDSDLEVTPSEEAWPAWDVLAREPVRYEAPADAAFERREVELVGKPGEPALFGEVLIPADADETKQGPVRPRPGIVFISSTGREDRHGIAGPPPVDLGTHVITDALANAGFVVMRFDERGTGRSDAAPAGFLDQVEDARRALRALLVQPEVDPDRIVLIGHGEGGWRALLVAASQRKTVVGVALLGTPGRPYREILLHQASGALSDVSAEARAEVKAQQRRFVEALERGETPTELREQAVWLREALAQEPERMLERGPSTLFIAQGGKDFEVDPVADPRALVVAAKKHGKHAQLKVYPQLDHRFVREPEQSSPQRYLESGRVVDAAFIADLVAWCRDVVRK